VQPGEHKAIVDEEPWNAVQARLAERRTHRRRAWRDKYEISLSLRLGAGSGILKCCSGQHRRGLSWRMPNSIGSKPPPAPVMIPRLSIITGNRCVVAPLKANRRRLPDVTTVTVFMISPGYMKAHRHEQAPLVRCPNNLMSNKLNYYDHCKNGYLYADQFEQELQRQQLSEECAKQEVIRWCTNHTER
jgi:hypothetical protein